MNTSLKSVPYSTPSKHDFQSAFASKHDFETTLTILRDGISSHDMWVIHEINPQMLLERGGFQILPARQILYFHPRYVTRILAEDPSALAEIPLKLLVLKMPDDTTTVLCSTVESLLGRYPQLSEMAKELSIISKSLMKLVI